jgi:chromosome segregation ATPase
MELLKSARGLRVELELTTNDISTLELQKQQIQNQCLMLESQANEQRLKETELLANAQRLREEALKAEGQPAECREGANRLDKKADGGRNSRKESETTIAATEKKAAEIKETLQRIRDELKI